MKNLGILLSGRGSNFEAIAKNVAAGKIPDAQIVIVISNKPDAGGLETARRIGLTALAIPSKGKAREEHDREVVAALKEHKVDLVCLAGYMRLLSPWFVQQFPQKILNIHPSLLPSFLVWKRRSRLLRTGSKLQAALCILWMRSLTMGRSSCRRLCPCLIQMTNIPCPRGFWSRNILPIPRPLTLCLRELHNFRTAAASLRLTRARVARPTQSPL